MAKVTLKDGTVVYDGETPDGGTAWTGAASEGPLDTTAHSAQDYPFAATSPELGLQAIATDVAKVTLNDGTVLFEGATPARGTAWTGVSTEELFDTTAHSAQDYLLAALSPELALQVIAGTAP